MGDHLYGFSVEYLIVPDDITFHGLHKWYEHIFQHLGWMVLCARKKTCKTKRIAYVMSIDKYMEMATYKIAKLSGSEKDDINILLNNIRLIRPNLELMVGITQDDVEQVKRMTGGAKKTTKKSTRK